MITNINMVTTTAIERFQANRRPLVFKDRMGVTWSLSYAESRDKPYSASSFHTRKSFRFGTLPELIRHLSEAA